MLDLGKTPPANSFLQSLGRETKNREFWFPLRVLFCNNCSLVQLAHVVDPKLLFKNYVYTSSTSKGFVRHFEDFALEAIDKFGIKKKDLVVDIGSNDGILLKPFAKRGIRVLGIEPAKNIAERANKDGIKTVSEFFGQGMASRLKKTNGSARLVTATNVFAHIDDLDEVIEGVKILLDNEGVFIIEVPYLPDFLRNNLFDTVYHEHLSYLAISPLKVLFGRMGMKVFAVSKVATHGGSVRVMIKKVGSRWRVESSLASYVAREKKLKLNTLEPYKRFATRVKQNRKALRNLLGKLKRQNKLIAGYGAPAKGNTLLNYFGIDSSTLDYVVDDSVYKQGLYTPGSHIPVVASGSLYKDPPDYVLILAWNFADQIMLKISQNLGQRTKFIIPVPVPKIIILP